MLQAIAGGLQPARNPLLALRSFFGDVASSGPTVGPDGKPLHNPHVIRVDVLEVRKFRGQATGGPHMHWHAQGETRHATRLRGCVHRQSAMLAARLTMRCFLQADDKYKILADVPGG